MSSLVIHKPSGKSISDLGRIISPPKFFKSIKNTLLLVTSKASICKFVDFSQYELAKTQMTGCGGLITIVLKVQDKPAVLRFIDAINNFLMAVSWGGYESLMIPSIIFHDMPGIPDSSIPWTYVRLYIGLENADYLIEDLEQALDKM